MKKHYPEFLVALRAATKNSTAPMQLFSPTVVHKVRTDHERAADKHKLAAMKETLVLNEQAADSITWSLLFFSPCSNNNKKKAIKITCNQL